MSRFCIIALFLVVVVFQFGNCADCDNITSKPGSDTTSLSFFEKSVVLFKSLKKLKDDIEGNVKSSKKSILKSVADKIRLIFPGTLWCGDGQIATKESELGFFEKTDACCRAHDNCNDNLLAGETKGNLKNNAIFTRSACTCDKAFYECLKKANNLVSNGIGKTYFNILKPQCYKCVCPSSTPDCKVNDRQQCEQTCKQYKWVDSPKY